PWQSPDEPAHFAYVQSLAENLRLPGAADRPGESSDQGFADASVGASRGAFWPGPAPPDWSRADEGAYLAREHGSDPPSRTDGGGASSADQNPPLYYLYGALAYLIDRGGTTFGQLFAIRIAGVLLLVLTTIGAWLLAGETFGRRRLAQLACAAVAGLWPMATFMSTAVNPDALLMPTWTWTLWLGARVINRRAPARDAVALCAMTAAAILTKATSYALVPAVLLALVIGWRRRAPSERGPALRRIAAPALALVVPVVGWLALTRALGRSAVNTIATSAAHPFNVRQFLSYLWQFYFPRLPFLIPFRTTPELPVYDIWVHQFTGVFGWLDVYLPPWMYPAAASAAAALAIVALALLSRLRERRSLALLAFFALALIGLLGLLHITEYRALISGGGQFVQGRYLLPVVGLLGLAVGLVVSRVPARARVAACSLTVVGLLAFQAVSLATVVQAYYL
ncbi:MAG: DUF2142 domain-containing protein, partial [Solirubrobacteraceae bacterium]